jgi:succinate dehydrogenase/fumarate reductase flavoprotein subunit
VTAAADTDEADVVVVGAGLGGVVAAARAAQLRRRVLLVEARPTVGGTALYSGGGVHIWGAQTWDEYHAHCPQADPVLARRLFEQYVPFVEWAVSTKAPGRYRVTTLRGHTNAKYQLGRTIAPHHRAAWFSYMVRLIERLGGAVRTGTRATGLLQEDGRVRGVTVSTGSDEQTVRAGAVILAAGGFQSEPALMERYVGDGAIGADGRAVAEDVGDGLRLALAAGGTTTRSMDTIYGHLMPVPPDWSDLLQPLLLTAFYAEHSIVVNGRGERFVDEGAGELNGETVNAAARQAEGPLWIVMDERVRRRHARYELPYEMLTPTNLRYARLLRYFGVRLQGPRPVVTVDSLRYAADHGAAVVRAPSLAALADELAARGAARDALLSTVAGFNEAVERGSAAQLPIPKTKEAYPIVEPPFTAVEVRPAASMTYGGVRIDEETRVLDEQDRPVKALYAVPGTAGGIHRLHYGGALAACAVYGKIAGEHAAAGV